MAENGLQKKQEKAESLRQAIRDERAKRESSARESAEANREKALDQELTRLAAELEAEKAITKAQQKSNKAAPKNTETAEAVNAAQSLQATAQRVAEDNKQNKEN